MEVSKGYTMEDWPNSLVSSTALIDSSFYSSAEIPWSEASVTSTSLISDSCLDFGNYQASVPRSIPVASSPTSDFCATISNISLFPQPSQTIGFDSKPEYRASGLDYFQSLARDDSFLEQNLSSFNSPTTEYSSILPDSFFPIQYHISNTSDYHMFPQTFDEPVPSLQDSMSVRSQYSPEFTASPYHVVSLESCNHASFPLSPALKYSLNEPILSRINQEIPRRSKNSGRHLEHCLPENTILLPSSGKKCNFEGCGKKFVRQEHLKRHQRTHYNSESFKCQFCDRSFSRSDNLLAHMKLHDKRDSDRPNRRTQYFKEAARVIEKMSRKRQKIVCPKKTTKIERKQKRK